MNKAAIGGSIAVGIAIVIFLVSYSSLNSETDTSLASQNVFSLQKYQDVGRMLGDANAPVTIVEFGDYQCAGCNKWFLQEKPTIETEFLDTGKANLIFIDFPFQGPDSYIAAEASWCADEQGKYFEYHSHLYVNQGNLEDGWASSMFLKEYALYLELDTDQFNSCLDSGKYSDRVAYNKQVGLSNGISGTPTFFILGPDGAMKEIKGPQPASVFIETINSML